MGFSRDQAHGFLLELNPQNGTPPAITLTTGMNTAPGGTTITGTVTLGSPAPKGGLVFTLASDNTKAVTVPATVTIAAGAVKAEFPITTLKVTTPDACRG